MPPRTVSSGHRGILGRVGDRVRACVSAAALDRELASGVPVDASPLLARRARALSRRAAPPELGSRLRRIVREAHQPAGPTAHVRANRARVVAAEDELRLLASRLESSRRVSVAGLAKVHVLLTDGTGPLYYRDSSEDLVGATREAIAALR